MSESTTYYVCDSAVDEPGRGTAPETPLKTAVAALTIGGPSATILFRKTPNDEYTPLGTSALKTAKKTVMINEKKAKKVEDAGAKAAQTDADRAAKDAKKLEDSKSVVLVEDSSLPTAVKVFPAFLALVSLLILVVRAKFKGSLPYVLNEFEYPDGSIVCVSRRK